jgi:tRNA(Ile2) C34 agmatinyltransferase TiaS
MAKYKEYKCESCCYTVAANPKGHDVVMMGEVCSCKCEDCNEIVDVLTSEKTVCPECGSDKLVKWNPIKGRCPKCGKKMKETGVIMMVD